MLNSNCSNQTAMANVRSTAGSNSGQTMELTLAAAEVVFRRMTLGGFAIVNPLGADHDEFARMVPEKTQAFSDAGSVLMDRSARIGQEVTRLFANEMIRAAETATAMLTIPNPASMMVAQAEAALSWAERVATLPRAICLLALEAQAAVMAPIHRTATNNLKRLRSAGVAR